MGIGRMIRVLAIGAILAGAAVAEEAAGVARVDPSASAITDRGRGFVVTLALSEAVPWRVFTLMDPMRLVLDLRTADWVGLTDAGFVRGDNPGPVQVGAVAGGWSRLVVELKRPLEVAQAGMSVSADVATLRLVLEATDDESFAAAAGAPPDSGGTLPAAEAAAPSPEEAGLVVAIDPGHGGIDPGAERQEVKEADLMLALAREVAEALRRAGMVPVLTREEDVFVPLQARMTRARAAGADVLISLHADALEGAEAQGASIYTLTEEAVSEASRGMVQRHGGGDMIAGLNLQGQDDALTTALMDLARLETVPRSETLARAMAEQLARAGGDVNARPLRQANLAVLKAADFPSVLLESGFLSDADDRARLGTPEGRAPVVAGVVAALRAWADAEAERARLLRR